MLGTLEHPTPPAKLCYLHQGDSLISLSKKKNVPLNVTVSVLLMQSQSEVLPRVTTAENQILKYQTLFFKEHKSIAFRTLLHERQKGMDFIHVVPAIFISIKDMIYN